MANDVKRPKAHPVVAKLAIDQGLRALHVYDHLSRENADALADTDWMLVSADPAILAAPVIRQGAKPIADLQHRPLWTDDFSNLFQILK